MEPLNIIRNGGDDNTSFTRQSSSLAGLFRDETRSEEIAKQYDANANIRTSGSRINDESETNEIEKYRFVVGITIHHNIFRWDHLTHDYANAPPPATTYDHRYNFRTCHSINDDTRVNHKNDPFLDIPDRYYTCASHVKEEATELSKSIQGKEQFHHEDRRRKHHNSSTKIHWINLYPCYDSSDFVSHRVSSTCQSMTTVPMPLQQLVSLVTQCTMLSATPARSKQQQLSTCCLQPVELENLHTTWQEFMAALAPVMHQFRFRMGLFVGAFYTSVVFLLILIPGLLIIIGISPLSSNSNAAFTQTGALQEFYSLPSFETVMFAVLTLIYLPAFLLMDFIIIRLWVHDLIRTRFLVDDGWQDIWLRRHGLELDYITIPCHHGFCGTLWVTSLNPTYLRFSVPKSICNVPSHITSSSSLVISDDIKCLE
jgi:hypothetical protein